MRTLSRLLILPLSVVLLLAQTPKSLSDKEIQDYMAFAKTRPLMVCDNGGVVYLDYNETDSSKSIFVYPMNRNDDSVGFVEKDIDGVADYFVRLRTNSDSTIGCEVVNFDKKKTDSLNSYYQGFVRHCIDPNAKCK